MKKLCLSGLCIIIFIFACAIPTPQTGNLLLSLDPQVKNRMIEPDFDMDPVSYVILGYGPNDSEFEQTIDETTVEITNLDFGEWEICVYARNQGGIVIADGCASAVVHAGTTTPVSIIVVPLDGTGILDLTVLWNEEDTEFPSIDSELIPANSAAMPLNFTISGGDTAVYHNNQIPTGYSTLIVKLMDGPVDNKILTIGTVEVVRIIKDQESKGLFEFYEINQAGGTITVNIEADMQNPIDVEMSGQVDRIYENQVFTVVASAPAETENLLYVWYLNGETFETGASCTIEGLGTGIYNLDVTAFTTNGKRAGVAHHLFRVVEFDTTHISDYLWSPDGSKIAFIKCEDGNAWNNDLWVADNNFYNPVLIKTGVSSSGLADWAGNAILFTKDMEDGSPGSYYGGGEYFSIAPDGTGEIQITYTYTNGIRSVFMPPYYNNIGTANWAKFVPGTNLVYFRAHNGNGWYHTYTCNADGTDNWTNISTPYYSWRLDVSPTGNKLFYGTSSNYYTPITFRSKNVDGTGSSIIAGPIAHTNFWSSKDGNSIIWCLNNSIYAVGIDGTGEHTVISDGYHNSRAGHGKSGDELLIYSDRSDGNTHIYSLNIAGGTPAQLTFGHYNDTLPAFSPDGSLFAYLRLPDTYSGSTSVKPYELIVK